MSRFLLNKTIQYGVVLFLAVTVNFALPRLMPGDPLSLLLGEDAALLPEETIQRTLTQYGLDRPLPEQYGRYLLRLLQGDLGYSYHWKQPVAMLVRSRLPWTLLLVGGSLLLSTIIGVTAGVVAAWHHRRPLDIGGLVVFLALDSMPVFWLGMLFIVFFGVHLRIFPLFGSVSLEQNQETSAYLLSLLKHLALPLGTLTLVSAGGMFLIARYAMLAEREADYVMTARARGLSPPRLLLGHALRNAALPITTAFLLRLGHLTGGSILVETVFSYPGMGRLMYQAVLSRDYPVVQGTFFIFTVTVVAANLLADLVYPLLDPRLKTHDNANI